MEWVQRIDKRRLIAACHLEVIDTARLPGCSLTPRTLAEVVLAASPIGRSFPETGPVTAAPGSGSDRLGSCAFRTQAVQAHRYLGALCAVKVLEEGLSAEAIGWC